MVLTEQKQRLVTILEIVQVEKYVSKSAAATQWMGRRPLNRQSTSKETKIRVVPLEQKNVPLVMGVHSLDKNLLMGDPFLFRIRPGWLGF